MSSLGAYCFCVLQVPVANRLILAGAMVSNVLFSKFCCFHFKIPFKERFEIAILELGRRDPVFGGWLLCLRCVLLLRFASFAFQSPHSSGSKVFLWHRSVRIVIAFCKPFVANHHHCHQHQRI